MKTFPATLKRRVLLTLMVSWTVFASGGAMEASDENPYRIGFVGGLTGRSSDLGIGALMGAFEIDAYGDAKREAFAVTVENSRFKVRDR